MYTKRFISGFSIEIKHFFAVSTTSYHSQLKSCLFVFFFFFKILFQVMYELKMLLWETFPEI